MSSGRKRKIGKREPSGKLSRTENRDDAMSVAIAYRQRVLGVSKADVMDQKASTLIGRLCLQGTISEQQWRAAEEWARVINAYHAAINAPLGFSTPTAGGGFTTDEAHAEICAKAKEKANAANDAVARHSPPGEAKERFIALRQFVFEGVYSHNLEGAFRMAANGLVRHFGLDGRKAA